MNKYQRYNQTEKGKEKFKRRNLRYPEKRKAYQILNNTIVAGKITRKPCEFCGINFEIEGHHYDYDKPLNVIWLCKQCHRILHEVIL